MGEVSAEEMVAGGAPSADTDGDELPYGPEADDTLRAEAAAAVTALWFDIDGKVMVDVIGNTIGYFPEIAARTIKGLAWFVDADATARAAASTPAPASPQAPGGEPSGASTPGSAEGAGQTFEDIATPPVVNESEPLGDEVDVDAIFDAEAQYME